MDLNCVSFRERSELVAALLVMRVRDVQAMLTRQRWLRVSNFMEKLVAYSDLQLCQNLCIKARPSCDSKKRSRNLLYGSTTS